MPHAGGYLKPGCGNPHTERPSKQAKLTLSFKLNTPPPPLFPFVDLQEHALTLGPLWLQLTL